MLRQSIEISTFSFFQQNETDRLNTVEQWYSEIKLKYFSFPIIKFNSNNNLEKAFFDWKKS